MDFDIKIKKYVASDTLNAISTAVQTDDITTLSNMADKIAQSFGAEESVFVKETLDFETKLIESFQKNLSLLIQKTWVEKSDAELKENVLYTLSEYCKLIQDKKWTIAYKQFLKIINDVVYLMFGQQTKSNDFCEYALRIDPDFGIFWLFIKSLPQENNWQDEKYRIIMLLGMYFLANY